MALFGRGHFLDVRGARSLAVLPAWIDGAVRLGPLISEAGFGIRKEGTSVLFVAGARTIWSNPDDVVHRLLAISSRDLLSGKGVEAGASIASAAPGSPFADDFRAGITGFMGFGFATGLLAGIVVAAWEDQVQHAGRGTRSSTGSQQP